MRGEYRLFTPEATNEWIDNVLVPFIAGVLVVGVAGLAEDGLRRNVDLALALYTAAIGSWTLIKMFRTHESAGALQAFRVFLFVAGFAHAILGVTTYAQLDFIEKMERNTRLATELAGLFSVWFISFFGARVSFAASSNELIGMKRRANDLQAWEDTLRQREREISEKETEIDRHLSISAQLAKDLTKGSALMGRLGFRIEHIWRHLEQRESSRGSEV